MIDDSAAKYHFRNRSFIFALWAGLTLIFLPPAVAREANPPRQSPAPAGEAQLQAIGISSLEQQLIEKGLVDVRTLDQSIMVDLKYARTDNFMGTNVYGDFTRAYLRPEAASKLARANEILKERHPNLRILVADALRPRFIQHRMWQHVVGTPMQPYVANPHSGSMHNHGGAVDVCLYDIEAQQRLDMGTPLDHFGPLAQPRLEARYLREGKLTEAQVQNRLILRNAMRDAGWHPLQIEWWHFDAFPLAYIRKNYSIID